MADKEEVKDVDIEDIDLEALAGEEDTPDVKDDDSKDTPEGDQTESLSETEKIAYAQGWRPKAEFVKNGGDPKAWKEAGWWMDRGELLGQQSQLRKEVKQIKEAFIKMTEYNRQAYIRGQEDAIQRMKADKRVAMKEGAFDVVADLDERIDNTQDALAVAKETQNTIKEELSPKETSVAESRVYQAWLADNQWYTTDEKLHNYANVTMANWVKSNPNSTPAEALAYLTKEIKETFPQKFTKNKVAQPGVNGRGSPTSSSSAAVGSSVQAKFQKIVNGMDPDTKRAVMDMIRTNDITMKEYVEMYQD